MGQSIKAYQRAGPDWVINSLFSDLLFFNLLDTLVHMFRLVKLITNTLYITIIIIYFFLHKFVLFLNSPKSRRP